MKTKIGNLLFKGENKNLKTVRPFDLRIRFSNDLKKITLKGNGEKWPLATVNKTLWITIDVNNITSNKKKIGIEFGYNRLLESHVASLCQKTIQKIQLLGRIVSYMDLNKVSKKAVMLRQLNYCPLVRMFHSRSINKPVSKIHERALKLAYKDNHFSHRELLGKDLFWIP